MNLIISVFPLLIGEQFKSVGSQNEYTSDIVRWMVEWFVRSGGSE